MRADSVAKGSRRNRTYGDRIAAPVAGCAGVPGRPSASSRAVRNTTVQLTLNMALQRDSLTVTARRNDTDGTKSTGYGIDARRSRPTGTGWGYAASLQRDGDFDRGFGQVEYQGAHGRVAMEADVSKGNTTARVFASGALVGSAAFVVTPPVEGLARCA